MRAYTKRTANSAVRFVFMRVTSEGNNTQIVVAVVGPIVVHVHAIAVSVTEVHKLAIRGKGRFASLHLDQGP